MNGRWLVVLLAAAALVGLPVAYAARPVSAPTPSAASLAALVSASGRVGWSGFVESAGTLQVPDTESFANLAQLLGESNRLRVWWRGGDDWRIDRIRSTGETDLFRSGATSIRWVFESETATISPVSRVRLPDASDLLPPTLGRSLLQGARPTEVAPMAARRVAGVDAAGLRLTPADAATTIDHVDLWADPGTGLPLRVDLYGHDDTRPTLSTELSEVDQRVPDPAATVFRPAADATIDFDESVDVAAAANAFTSFDLPPTLAGLPVRSGRDPGAVGVYGRGPTTLIAFPLRGQVAGPLRERLQASPAARRSAAGTVAPIGPVTLFVTDGFAGPAFLLAGTVTAETLEQAATELERRP